MNRGKYLGLIKTLEDEPNEHLDNQKAEFIVQPICFHQHLDSKISSGERETQTSNFYYMLKSMINPKEIELISAEKQTETGGEFTFFRLASELAFLMLPSSTWKILASTNGKRISAFTFTNGFSGSAERSVTLKADNLTYSIIIAGRPAALRYYRESLENRLHCEILLFIVDNIDESDNCIQWKTDL